MKLPDRWLTGFGEVQALARYIGPLAELAGGEARRFLQSVPRTARRPLWAVSAGPSLRLATSPEPGAACIAGPYRLAELRPLLPFIHRLRVYGPVAGNRSLPMSSAWELDLGAARFTLTLSPEKYRGFSAEGGLLGLLADDQAASDADMVDVLLPWDRPVDAGRLLAMAGLGAKRVTAALSYLAATGRVGFDLAENAYFRRELPFAPPRHAHPRLATGSKLASSVKATDHGALVRHDGIEHRVTFTDEADICTCPWWGKHRGTRGPCSHVLAARMAADS